MGYQALRNLSVLLVASAALMGCNNGPQKDKSLGAGPKLGDPPALGKANQQQQPQWQGQGGAFPVKPAGNLTPNNQGSPFGQQPAGGAPNQGFVPQGGDLNGVGKLPSAGFPPIATPTSQGKNVSPDPYQMPTPPAPQPGSGFGATRDPFPASPQIPVPPPPGNFPNR